MYTEQQVQAVVAYNAKNYIFRTSPAGRIVWTMRNVDVANLQQLGINIATAADFALLKKQVKQAIVA